MPYSLLPQYFCIKEIIKKKRFIFTIRPLFFGDKLWTWTFLCWSYWKTLRTRGTFLIYSHTNNKPCTYPLLFHTGQFEKWLSVTSFYDVSWRFTSFHCRRRDVISTCLIHQPLHLQYHSCLRPTVDSDPVDLKGEILECRCTEDIWRQYLT